MHHNNGSGTLNGNQTGTPEARPQPIPSSQGVGGASPHPASLGAAHECAEGLRPQASAEHPGRRAPDRSSGFHSADDLIAATLSLRLPRQPPTPEGGRRSYAQKLRDVRWKRRRDDLLRQRNYTCCECAQPLTTGTMDLQVHHVVYISGLDPWDYPDELLLVVCPEHHRVRAALEQAIYLEVGQHLATRDIPELQRQPVYAFFEDDPLLAHLPGWMQDLLSYPPNQPEPVTIGCEKTSCPLKERIHLRLAAAGVELTDAQKQRA